MHCFFTFYIQRAGRVNPVSYTHLYGVNSKAYGDNSKGYGDRIPEQNKACTRAVYLGPDDMIVTGRTMDWKEDPQSNIYLFPRGMEKRGDRKSVV